MVLETLAFVLDLVGVLVGLAALSLAVWALFVYRGLFDATYVAALYIVGTILVFISSEVRLEANVFLMVARSLIFVSIAFWEYVIFVQLWNFDADNATNATAERFFQEFDKFGSASDSDEDADEDDVT